MPYALVSGADRGLGFSLCEQLLEMGWTVYAGKYLADYALLEALGKRHAGLIILPLDTSARASIQAAMARTRETGLDMMIHNAALMGSQNGVPAGALRGEAAIPADFMRQMFLTNSVGALQLTELALPSMEGSRLKRLCYISSEVSSITLMQRTEGFGYPMSKAALNMAVRIMHNTLQPEGYRFRLYHPGWMRRVMPDGTRGEVGTQDPDDSARQALKGFLSDRGDEHRLVLEDYLGHEWPF